MISTKARYAIRVMIDLAEHDGGKYIPLKDIAERQEISKKRAGCCEHSSTAWRNTMSICCWNLPISP